MKAHGTITEGTGWDLRGRLNTVANRKISVLAGNEIDSIYHLYVVLFATVLVRWLFEFYALLNKADECGIFSEYCKKISRDKKENSQTL